MSAPLICTEIESLILDWLFVSWGLDPFPEEHFSDFPAPSCLKAN